MRIWMKFNDLANIKNNQLILVILKPLYLT